EPPALFQCGGVTLFEPDVRQLLPQCFGSSGAQSCTRRVPTNKATGREGLRHDVEGRAIATADICHLDTFSKEVGKPRDEKKGFPEQTGIEVADVGCGYGH